MKTSELIGPALDWAVAKCVWTDRQIIAKVGCRVSVPVSPDVDPNDATLRFFYEPSTNWEQGGPIMERKGISPLLFEGQWFAFSNLPTHDCIDDIAEGYVGPTPLIAAMRCYVASELGDEVEIPEEMK